MRAPELESMAGSTCFYNSYLIPADPDLKKITSEPTVCGFN